jgi:NAD(P)-dependent dehydrogenase (short-subunit alcohol dehydrogenase family)
MKSNYPTNTDIAAALDRIADLLHVQGANSFRVGAYRRAARQVRAQTRSLARWVLSEACSQLETLPDIGKRIAAIICEFVHQGQIGLLERLEGEVSPEDRFRTVSTIGPELSRRICSTLDIETLEELEIRKESTMKRIENKVAVVTGGARGIGRAICEMFAREGAAVAVTDIIEDEGRQVVDQIQAQGGKAAFWRLDTSAEENIRQVFSELKERLGGFHVLVNNAGISGTNKPTHEIEAEAWDQVIRVNVKGVFLCTKHAVPYMQEEAGGSIINLSSIYGLVGAPDLPAYHASKGAVRLMTKTDALLYAADNIRVNSIHPGYIWTPLVADLAESSGEGVDDFRAQLDAKHPIGHVGEPDDIAYGALYLASDESTFVTGSELVIDGGYTAQ